MSNALNFSQEEMLIESRTMRDSLADRVEVLNKVKGLALLPDGIHATKEQVAMFYQVNKNTMDTVIARHRNELINDGMRVLTGDELSLYKKDFHNESLFARSNLALFPRRAILRIGMLLRDSEVAKQIRSYLLNVEEATRQEAPHIIEGRVLPRTFKDALVLLLEEVEKNEELTQENTHLRGTVEIMAPKVEVHDHIMCSESSVSVGEGAKTLNFEGIGRNKLFRILRAWKHLNDKNEPYQPYINQGLYEVILSSIRRYNRDIAITVTHITPKGLSYICKRMLQEDYKIKKNIMESSC